MWFSRRDHISSAVNQDNVHFAHYPDQIFIFLNCPNKNILTKRINLKLRSNSPGTLQMSTPNTYTGIVICVSRPKSASFSSESGFSGRGAAEA
jgi:hypothetical protein